MYVKAVGAGLISPQVQSKRHLLELSKVCRIFRSLLFPRLFEVLAIKPCGELLLWDLEWYPFFDQDMIAGVSEVLAAVKELRFSAPFEDMDLVGLDDLGRCPHFSIVDSSASSIDSPRSESDSYLPQEDNGKKVEELFDIEYGDNRLVKLSSRIMRLLSALPDNQLTSFR